MSSPKIAIIASAAFAAILISVQLGCSQTGNVPSEKTEAKFGIGSKAPPLEIQHWFSDDAGKFQPVHHFQPDHVYVIEFWATWCPPCIAAMPHLSRLQEKYRDQNVQIISVSDEDYQTVEDFLKRRVTPNQETTYADITQSYYLTTDPDQSVKKDYFEAAGLSGIPNAFIVGKSGLIEWIGHPMEMDDPLSKIVEGSWDRDEFVIEYRKKQAESAAIQKIQSKLFAKIGEVEDLLADDKAEQAIEILDDLLEDNEFAVVKDMIAGIKTQISILFVGGPEGAKQLLNLANENKQDTAMISEIVVSIYQQHLQAKPLDPNMLDATVQVAEMALDSDQTIVTILRPLARLLAEQKNLDRAIEVQTQLVELSVGQTKEEDQEFLDQLIKEKAKEEK